MDLQISIDRTSSALIYIQLSQAIKAQIISGALAAGSLLPTTRHLAQSLGLSRGTVLKAYDDLIAQGYLDATVGSGTSVSMRAHIEHDSRREISEPACDIEALGAAHGLSRAALRLLEIKPSTAIAGYSKDLNYGAPPLEALPVNGWKEALAKQAKLLQPHHFDYTPETLGSYQLRREIAAFLARSRGLKCSAEQIVVFSGSQQALNSIAKILIDPGDLVVVENPGYGGARDNFSAYGAKLAAVGIDQDGLMIDELDGVEGPVKAIYVTPSHHDPTGITMSLARRQALIEWANRHDAIIIEDGWDSDYSYQSAPLQSLQGLDRENRVIYLYTFWKVLYPLSTIGCAVLPLQLVPAIDRLKFFTERQFPLVEHLGLAEFIRTGALEQHVKRSKTNYAGKRKLLKETLFTWFKTDVQILQQSAALHLCVRFADHLQTAAISRAKVLSDLPMISTGQYYLHSEPTNEFLISFAGLSEDAIAKKVGLFAQFLGY